MKKGILIKEGKSWKISSPTFKQPMTIDGDFGLNDDMENQEIEFDNSGGPLKMIRFNGMSFTKKDPTKNQSVQEKNQNYSNMNDNALYGTVPIGKAHAPYNFVPINHVVVKSQLNPDSIEFNKYNSNRFNGFIKLDIVSQTPLYIRGNRRVDPDLSFQSAEFFSGKDYCIPGSSLRGLLRSMVEITSYSKMSSVSKSTESRRFHYRAFADKSLTLRNAYSAKMISDDQNHKCYYPKIKAGVLIKKGRKYFICEGEYYKVEEDDAKLWGIISNLMSYPDHGRYKLNNKYIEQFKPVYFQAESEKIHRNHSKPLKYAKIVSLSDIPKTKHTPGYIVCSGWMIGPNGTRGKHMHWVIGNINRNNSTEVDNAVIENYISDSNRKGTDLIQELQKRSVTEVPCFYITDTRGNITSFGATGMFRLAYDKTLIDFYPDNHRQIEQPDFANILFGNNKLVPGRVFVEDCILKEKKISQKIIIPEILGSPKPTTFQHYLKQNEKDIKSVVKQNKLSGFKGINDYNQDAEINGFKLYWHHKNIKNPERIKVKKNSFDTYLSDQKKRHLFSNLIPLNNSYEIVIKQLTQEQLQILASYNLSQSDSQYTAMVPVLENAVFEGAVRFENLTKEELGALLFVLDMEDGLCYKIGMGKPLGFGSVSIKSKTYVLDREKRYTELLFDWQNNYTSLTQQEVENFKSTFEKHILSEIKSSFHSLWDEERMKELRAMLDIGNSIEGEKARYMMIDKPGVPANEKNEFSKRPILPSPTEYIKTS